MNNFYLIIIFIVIVALFLIFFIVKKVKHLRFNNVVLITGGVKCGKTTFAVHQAFKKYKSVHRFYCIKYNFLSFLNFFIKVFNYIFSKSVKFINLPEEPHLYSNISLSVPYVPLTNDLCLRKNFRFSYKSVVLISESSLFASQYSIKDKNLNDRLSFFNKLFGHETKGGFLFYETQNLQDNHFAIKRVVNSFYWVQSITKWVPFVLIFHIRELAYLDGNDSVVNTFNSDISDDKKIVLVRKKVFKLFDSYTYSAFTDNLPVYDNVIIKDKKDLKSNEIISLDSSSLGVLYENKKDN